MRLPFVAAALSFALACARDNPPETSHIQWDSPETEALARRACYDCHSNETHWPGYSAVPGVRALVTSDVHRGRCHMNFSHWDRGNEDAWEAAEKLLEGEMPLPMYARAHAEARLTDEERAALAAGFERTFDLDPPLDGEPCEGEDD